MEIKQTKNADGTITLQLTLTEEGLDKFLSSGKALTAPETATAAPLTGGGNDYCVTCTADGPKKGHRETIRCGNDVFAFFTALKICGPGFSLTDGICK